MLKICRKTKFINYEYYNNHTLIGKITNKIFINIIKFNSIYFIHCNHPTLSQIYLITILYLHYYQYLQYI